MTGESSMEWTIDGVNLRALPKVSLHDHLDGGMRAGTILELLESGGIAVPESVAVSGDIRAMTSDELGAWIAAQSGSGSLVDYLKIFDLTCALLQTEEGLVRVAREAVLDLAADGVVYTELRWAPEQHIHGGLSLDDTVAFVQQGIEQGIQDAAALGQEIRAGQLITAMRHANRSLEIAELALRHRNSGAVGFDIAGAELGFPPSNHAPAFRLLAENMFPATIHAGEADGVSSIESAIVDGYALRLGHGVRLVEDITVEEVDADTTTVSLGDVARWVRDRGITLEMCPTSNIQTGAIAARGSRMEDHPFDLFYQLGFSVTVSSDNRTVSGTTLTRELGLLTEAFGYGLDDLEAFQLNAAVAAFLPLEDREELAEIVHEGFVDAVANARAGG
jgi:adenosine deaminase